MKRPFFLSILIAGTLFSCQSTSSDGSGAIIDSIALNAISADRFIEHVKVLSSDDFMGRKPFTKGDTLSVEYIEAQFRALGLTPGNNGSYFQEVPMAEVTSSPPAVLTFTGENGSVGIDFLSDYVAGSRHLTEVIDIPKTDVVFAGFGIVAPEYDWDDYADIDVKGKTVLVMVNDPGFYDKTLFKGDTMTYYGRWTYKYEEAARQGAAGVLIIHDTAAASYGWNVVRTGWGSTKLYLEASDNNASRSKFEGWISTEATERLFKLSGTGGSLLNQAKSPGFKAVDLKLSTSVNIKNTFRKSASNNVIATLPGSERPDEYIIYTAHWDHLGIGETVDGDSIYNGAIDNAIGIAALFELAEAFKASPIPPARTIVFLAVTAEEEGLLGSAYYADNPIFPLNKTVANINIDALAPVARTRDFSIVGLGQSDLDDYAARAAERQGRVIVASGNPSSGGFFRSDHFNFARVGIPALYGGTGSEFVGIDSIAITSMREALSGRYHHVSDHYDEYWHVDGIIENIHLLYDVGYTLSMEKTFPGWKTGSEFKTIGENR